MSDIEVIEQSRTVDQAEIGRYLAQLREQADMKQAELARKIKWSPAVLS